MLDASAKKARHLEPGDNVAIPVSNLDRARSDHRNLLGTVMSKNEHGVMTIGTQHGILQSGYLDSQVIRLQNTFVASGDVPDNTCSLRTAASKESAHGGQGFTRCHCVTGCAGKRCACKKKKYCATVLVTILFLAQTNKIKFSKYEA